MRNIVLGQIGAPGDRHHANFSPTHINFIYIFCIASHILFIFSTTNLRTKALRLSISKLYSVI